jgi:predicted outer membrane repeat protein
MTRWLSNRLGLSSRPASRRKAPAATYTFRPTLEALEDRWLPSTLTVSNNLDSGTGSLRAEIAAAKNNDTIVFAPSLKGQTVTLTGGELLISKNLAINGPGASQLTISGNNASRVFDVEKTANSVTLSGLTISNGSVGYYSNNGGGIDNYGGLTVSDCTVSGNTADLGGGIYCESGSTLTVTNCTLSGNRGNAAIFNWGMLTVTGGTVSNNQGYGIRNGGYRTSNGTLTGGTASINDCTVSSNAASGIYNGNVMTVSNCTISNNSAPFSGASHIEGGGILCAAGTLTVSNCTISGNAAFYGGGIYVSAGTLTLSGCTVTGNYAQDAGGGLYIEGTYGATVTVKNSSKITGNTAPVGFGPDVYNLGTVYLDSTSIIGILDGNPANPI